MIIQNNCLECNEVLRGRYDKKFCSDGCRNVHNNRINGSINNYVRNVNNVLKKNRRILEALHKLGDKQVHKGMLVEMEFNFQYFTHKKVNRDSITFCVYDYEYTTKEHSKFVEISPTEIDIITARKSPKKPASFGSYRPE
ncbi:MAG: hypothetical protein ACKOX3_11365 [Bacteroidota bacterium]